MEESLGQSRTWVYRAVGLLSFNGGLVNCVTFASFLHYPVGYVTGNITLAASLLVDSEYTLFLNVFSAILAFLLGAITTGFILPHNDLTRGYNYNLVLIIQILLVLISLGGLLLEIEAAKYLLAIAMGMQNGITTFYGKSVIRTTHMTGTTTDLGIIIAQKLKGHKVQNWRFYIYLSLLCGFFLGSIIGMLSFKLIGYYSLLISVAICLAMLRRD